MKKEMKLVRRKENWKRVMALTLSAVMMFGLMGCGDNGEAKESENKQSSEESGSEKKEESSTGEESKESSSEQESAGGTEANANSMGWAYDLGDQEWTGEEATLSLMSFFSPDPSSSTSWWEDEIRKYTGVTFQRESSQNGNFANMLTSGELTDIVGFEEAHEVVAAAEAGKLINLDDYKEQLPNIYQNPLLDSALRFWRENRCGGLDGLYVAPTGVGNNDSTTEIPMIRYDVWKKIGSPQPANMDEYFQMLKDMNEANPTAMGVQATGTDDGKPCYAIVGWDDNNAFAMNWLPYYGWFNLSRTVVAKGDGSQVLSIFDDSLPTKQMLKNLNDLWRNGYVHPDSSDMDYATAKPIFDNGHGLMISVEWMGGKYNDIHTDETGNMTVWADDFDIYINADAAVGNKQCIGISSDCENLDAALRFLNWYYSPTAYNLVKNGPEGYLWEYTDDGKQTFTADGIEKYRTNREEIGSGGDLFNAQQFLNAQPYSTFVLNPTTGQPLYHEYWDAFYETEQRWGQLEWRRTTGFTRTVDMARANGAKTKSMAFSLIPTVDPDLEQTVGALQTAWKTYSWKMAKAEDDDAFEKLWNECKEECDALGQEDVLNWYTEKFEEAQKLAEQYPLKTSWD